MGLSTGRQWSLKRPLIKSSFCLAYVLFVATSVVVEMIRDGSSAPSGRKCVIGAAVSYVVAGDTVIGLC